LPLERLFGELRELLISLGAFQQEHPPPAPAEPALPVGVLQQEQVGLIQAAPRPFQRAVEPHPVFQG